jgi:hypothetical protein
MSIVLVRSLPALIKVPGLHNFFRGPTARDPQHRPVTPPREKQVVGSRVLESVARVQHNVPTCRTSERARCDERRQVVCGWPRDSAQRDLLVAPAEWQLKQSFCDPGVAARATKQHEVLA